MVNAIWLLMLAAGIVVAAINGEIEVVTKAALESAHTAVTIALELIGVMALWMGLLQIAEAGGLVQMLSRLLRPVTSALFPSIPRDHPAMGAILMNLGASILGLGNAATPFGLKAMQQLQTLNPRQEEATEAMCTFLALNTSCITLVPATIIAIRLAAGSADPTAVVGPTIMATSIGMCCAVIADRLFRRYYRIRGS